MDHEQIFSKRRSVIFWVLLIAIVVVMTVGCETVNDSDEDGINDIRDKCPGTPAGETVNEEGCSLSQIDTDSDGVFDNVDVCPETPENDNPDENGCGESQRVPMSTIPDTGQITCYDAYGASIECPSEGDNYYGQDATYVINPPSYTKLDSNGNSLSDSVTSWAMVKDNVTGLIWEVKTDDGGIHDRDNKYIWQDVQDVFIAQLNADRFGGYSDWRMPTVKELTAIVDYGATYDLAVNTDYFVNTQSSAYWTSTSHAEYPGQQAWVVFFGVNLGDLRSKSMMLNVRAVRGEN